MLVTVEVAEERVQAAMRRQAQKLAKDMRFPGFRPGKMPYQLIAKRLGEDYIRAQTAEALGQDIFQEMLEQVDFKPYEQSALTDITLQPMTYHFLVPLTPVAVLGEYRDFRYGIKTAEVTEEMVSVALEQLREERKTMEPVDRPVQAGDLIVFTEVVTITNESGGEELLFDTERGELTLDPATIERGPLFVDNLVGLWASESKKFTIVYPEEHADSIMAGKAVTFDLTILDVKSQVMPQLDDDFAKAEGDYETLEELRADIHHKLEREAKRQAIFDLFDVMLTHLRADAQITYPPIAITRAVDDRVETYKQNVSENGWKWEDFLQLQGETEDSLREKLFPAAVEGLENSAIIAQFVVLEKLTVSSEDVIEEAEKRITTYTEDEETRKLMAHYLLMGSGREQLLTEVMIAKVHERMAAILSGQAPDLDSLADEQTTDDEEE